MTHDGKHAFSKEDIARMQERIIEEMMKKRSLRDILANDEDLEFPSPAVVYAWLNPASKKYDEEFANNYAHAREIRAELMFEEMLDIADTPVIGKTITQDADGGITVKTADMIAHRNLQVSTRQWALARMSPKKYGNKLETTLQGGDKPIETVDMSKLTPEVLEELAKQSSHAASHKS